MVKGGHGVSGAADARDKSMRTEASEDISSRAQLEPRIQTEIGKHLRAIYDDVINEPVPSKFMELLEQLEQSTTRKN
jgi:hypothetical protein